MISPRTLLLAEQAFRAEGHHASADLVRDAAEAISRLRGALVLAQMHISAERKSLIECHSINGVIPGYDAEGLAGVADLDDLLAKIDGAMA